MKRLFVLLCCLFAISLGAQCTPSQCQTAKDCSNSLAVCCGGYCVDPLPLGSACGGSVCGSCQDYCVNGKCTEFDIGCSCATDADCGSDTTRSFCLAGTCTTAHTLAEGEACQNSKQCYQASNLMLYCIGSTCQGNLTVNQTCMADQGSGTGCASNLYCDTQQLVCTPRSALGEPCSTSSDCFSGYQCSYNSTSGRTECAALTPNGGMCSYSGSCASGACRLSDGTCVAAGSLPTGAVCDSAMSCVSGSCQIGAANYTQYCYAPASTIPNGEWCNLLADNCIGVCQCNSTRCGMPLAPTPACISAKSLNDGSICQTSLQCKNRCDNQAGICYTPNSIAAGGACTLNDACMGTMRCVAGNCTVIAAGSACGSDTDCATNQECVCNGKSNGTCQVTAFSTIESQYNALFYQSCPQLQELVYYRYAGYCGGYNDNILQAPAFCQKLVAQSTCCQGCILVNATNIFKNLSSNLDYGSSTSSFVVDCANYTLSALTTECCGQINSTCAFNKDISSTKNCPGIYSPSSTSMSGSKSSTVSGSTGNSTVSSTAKESDADVMRVGMMTIVAILSLFA